MNPTPPLKKILYVEDEADIREVAQIGLEHVAGFTVRACASGAAALDELCNFIPDLILLDVMMPQMDGITLYGRIRAEPRFARTPIVFITARVQPSDIARYKSLGAAGVIAKPFDPMTLGAELIPMWNAHQAAHLAGATS
jgi:two-component system, OmpR family, response regulator